jgi:hypothetical protein
LISKGFKEEGNNAWSVYAMLCSWDTERWYWWKGTCGVRFTFPPETRHLINPREHPWLFIRASAAEIKHLMLVVDPDDYIYITSRLFCMEIAEERRLGAYHSSAGSICSQYMIYYDWYSISASDGKDRKSPNRYSRMVLAVYFLDLWDHAPPPAHYAPFVSKKDRNHIQDLPRSQRRLQRPPAGIYGL